MGRYQVHRSDANASKLYDYAEMKGFSVEKIDTPVDALLGKYGLTVACEIKTAKGKKRPRQVKFFDTFKGMKAIIRETQHIDELDRRLRSIARKVAGLVADGV